VIFGPRSWDKAWTDHVIAGVLIGTAVAFVTEFTREVTKAALDEWKERRRGEKSEVSDAE